MYLDGLSAAGRHCCRTEGCFFVMLVALEVGHAELLPCKNHRGVPTINAVRGSVCLCVRTRPFLMIAFVAPGGLLVSMMCRFFTSCSRMPWAGKIVSFLLISEWNAPSRFASRLRHDGKYLMPLFTGSSPICFSMPWHFLSFSKPLLNPWFIKRGFSHWPQITR